MKQLQDFRLDAICCAKYGLVAPYIVVKSALSESPGFNLWRIADFAGSVQPH